MLWTIVCTIFWAAMTSAEGLTQVQFMEPLAPTIRQLASSFNAVPIERKRILDQAGIFLQSELERGKSLQLTFVCTHNSRRSHFAQIWAQVAAEYYGVPRVTTFSGGTEATACDPRTVHSLRRFGFQVVATTAGDNPRYLVQYAENRIPTDAYSKVYNAGGNPTSDYVAFMCCADADKNCPVVSGSVARFALDYIDPKLSDGTDQEAATYDQRSLQIAHEMFYLFSRLAAE